VNTPFTPTHARVIVLRQERGLPVSPTGKPFSPFVLAARRNLSGAFCKKNEEPDLSSVFLVTKAHDHRPSI